MSLPLVSLFCTIYPHHELKSSTRRSGYLKLGVRLDHTPPAQVSKRHAMQPTVFRPPCASQTPRGSAYYAVSPLSSPFPFSQYAFARRCSGLRSCKARHMASSCYESRFHRKQDLEIAIHSIITMLSRPPYVGQ